MPTKQSPPRGQAIASAEVHRLAMTASVKFLSSILRLRSGHGFIAKNL